MAFLGLSDQENKKLEYEVIPWKARLRLTRLLHSAVNPLRPLMTGRSRQAPLLTFAEMF